MGYVWIPDSYGVHMTSKKYINTSSDGMSEWKGYEWIVPLAQHKQPHLTISNRYEKRGRKNNHIKYIGSTSPSSFLSLI